MLNIYLIGNINVVDSQIMNNYKNVVKVNCEIFTYMESKAFLKTMSIYNSKYILQKLIFNDDFLSVSC